MKPPTYEELEEIVEASIADPSRALGPRFNDLVWGEEGPPEWWRDVPQSVVRAWDVACSLWAKKRPQELARSHSRSRRKNAAKVSAEDAWRAIAASALEENTYHRLAWKNIASRLGLPSRSAQYQLVGMGFDFAGLPGTKEPRRVTHGPCIGCGEAKSVSEALDDTFHCAQCRMRSAA